MKILRIALTIQAVALLGMVLLAPAASAAPAPAWLPSVLSFPTNFSPGSDGAIVVEATNVGGAPTTGATSIEIALPAGLTVSSAILRPDGFTGSCTKTTSTAVCETSDPVKSSTAIWLEAKVHADPAPPPGSASVEGSVSGGGAADASASGTVALQTSPLPFDFLAPPGAPLTTDSGSPSLLAGSHPYQQTNSIEFPTTIVGKSFVIAAGHARDIQVELPPGLIGNPSATPVLCTEVQLEGKKHCPDESAVGVINIASNVGVATGFATSPLYNMVPPPGYPAAFGADVAQVGLPLHLLPSVRSDGDYGISVEIPDIIAFSGQPVFGTTALIWGDPSSPLHDQLRGECQGMGAEACPVEPQQTAFWTMPAHCDGNPLLTKVSADSWEEPGVFHHASYASADLAGNPVSVSGCNALNFEPTISAQPTTNLVDSPSGLDVDLHQPQDTDKDQRSTPPLRDATVTLPEGMSVNPSQADGLGACSTAQVGLTTAIGAAPVHFDKTPNSCPEAAKLGTVEVTTPLLAQYTEGDTKRVDDPETHEPIPRVLRGSVYLAKPFANPFGSLLALYLTVEDPRSGTVAKLAGRVEPDPATGRLTTVFEENPQLPIEDIRLHLFGGARGALITPPACGTNTTTTDLVPWSAPETPDANPSSSFQTTATPAPGACPAAANQAPNAPTFTAGTLSPAAGAYSPFVLKLSREDGTQRLVGFDTTLPPGLTGKLAGIATCSDAQIAQAQVRSKPEEGILERNSPSCPAASALGSVVVGAGAGPTPFYAQGTAYLAGPYKGAPLSMVVITPAIAGPFDLGTVVVRAALNVDPRSARIHAVSDPFPTILHGIPLDLRSVAVKLDRPSFTLNPTSCDPMAITGSAGSAFGQLAPLSQPFQVGGCSSLAFKPKLAIKLTGGTKRSKNPALKATLKMPAGGTNIAKASVALPHSEFLDQSHIRTVCTRVQFAEAGGNGAGCPAGSVYGRARAVTPLLDSPLEGPVFLRSNPEHELPDLVAALAGRIPVELVGRIDSVKGGIRTTFEGVPDAPVSKFVLEMQGGRKGLLENSVNLCRTTNRATALFDAQNGKVKDFNPVVGNSCGRKKNHHRGPRSR